MFTFITCHEDKEGCGSVALLFFNLAARWGRGKRHVPAALPPEQRTST